MLKKLKELHKDLDIEKEPIVVKMVSDFDELTPLKLKIEKNGLKN